MTQTHERQVAREALQRTATFAMAKRADDDEEGRDGLTLEGHAAVFDSTTLINSWEGRFYEKLARGSWKKTLAERTPVLQFDHGAHPLIGSIPIGRIKTAKEDTRGAYVKARLHDNWLIEPVRDAIESESITGMSFRFTVVREEWHRPDGTPITDDRELIELMWSRDEEDWPTRTLREVKVAELGPVVFPAYPDTDVGVRSGVTTIDLGRLRTDSQARRDLARALFAAEQAEQDATTDDAARDDEAAGDNDTTPTDSGDPQQRDTGTEPATGHSDEPPTDAPRAGHRSDTREPLNEGHSQHRTRLSRERRRMTLDYVTDRLHRARERTELFASRVEELERHTQNDD